jgi:hypothetical protein
MDNDIEFHQDVICAHEPKMLLYKSEQFCKILNAKPKKNKFGTLTNVVINSQGRRKCTKFKLDSESFTLVGYYIQPVGNVNDGVPNDYLIILPVWLYEDNQNYIEYVQNINSPIVIRHNATNYNLPPNWDHLLNNIDILATLEDSQYPIFNHSDLQFSYLGDAEFNFSKAYISRHELFLLSQSSDFIGIAGARISSGNILASNPENISIRRNCNLNYFTYRFLAFNSFNITIPNDFPIERSKVIGLKLASYNKSTSTYSPATPTETWAVPCPPMWKPGVQ